MQSPLAGGQCAYPKGFTLDWSRDKANQSEKIYTDLTDTEWATLDAFEDPTYTLATVRVLLPSGIERDALSYVWRGDEHIDQPWSLADFGRDELIDYLNRCRSWRRRYEQGSS